MAFCISPKELGILVALLGTEIACDLNDEEQNLVGNFFVAVGSVILAVNAQGSYLESLSDDDDQMKMKTKIKDLEKQVRIMKSIIIPETETKSADKEDGK